MAQVVFDGVGKVYSNGTRAVRDLNVEIADGEFLVLVGPSGCGKTTALRMLAGLEAISEGEIRLDDSCINLVPPQKRDIAMVFQNYALYPHLSVFENIAFPLRSRHFRKDEVRERVERTAALLELGELLEHRPRTLSGGQRQRVAMGRAVVREPKVFLMDEPLSNLDAKLRVQMRAEILKLQRQLRTTAVYVTHDQVEALTMGDRIVVMRKGELQQCGPPQELYDDPANLFVATFIGSPAMNLLRSRLERAGDGLELVVGGVRVALPRSGPGLSPELAGYVGRELAVGIRPEHLTDGAGRNGGTPLLRGTVTLVESVGSDRFVHLELPGHPVMTDEVLEVAQDTDAAVAQTLRRGAAQHEVPVVARFEPRSNARAGELREIAVECEYLHLFDLQTGQAIR
jgi:multiple sugar transport system ATP-binding protein